MIIELIRHGKTEWQEEKRYQGSSDVPLSTAGRAELQPAQEIPECLVVTDLKRTWETAECLFPTVDVGQYHICEGLREMDFGHFEGRNYKEMEQDPEYRTWVENGCMSTCPGGESRASYSERVCNAFTELLKECRDIAVERLTIVAHGGTQMAVLERFARAQKDYYAWQLPCGQGYRMKLSMEENQPVLDIIEVTDYRKQSQKSDI